MNVHKQGIKTGTGAATQHRPVPAAAECMHASPLTPKRPKIFEAGAAPPPTTQAAADRLARCHSGGPRAARREDDVIAPVARLGPRTRRVCTGRERKERRPAEPYVLYTCVNACATGTTDKSEIEATHHTRTRAQPSPPRPSSVSARRRCNEPATATRVPRRHGTPQRQDVSP
jgi:hypothetical protein